MDAILTKEIASVDFEVVYIDITTPEVLDYLEDVNTIVENRLPLPYVAIGNRPVCWGEEDAASMCNKISEFIKSKSR